MVSVKHSPDYQPRKRKTCCIWTCCIAPDSNEDFQDTPLDHQPAGVYPQQQQQQQQLLQKDDAADMRPYHYYAKQLQQQTSSVRTVTVASSASQSSNSNDAASATLTLLSESNLHSTQPAAAAAAGRTPRIVPSTAATAGSGAPSRTATPLNVSLAANSTSELAAAVAAIAAPATDPSMQASAKHRSQPAAGDEEQSKPAAAAADGDKMQQQQPKLPRSSSSSNTSVKEQVRVIQQAYLLNAAAAALTMQCTMASKQSQQQQQQQQDDDDQQLPDELRQSVSLSIVSAPAQSSSPSCSRTSSGGDTRQVQSLSSSSSSSIDARPTAVAASGDDATESVRRNVLERTITNPIQVAGWATNHDSLLTQQQQLDHAQIREDDDTDVDDSSNAAAAAAEGLPTSSLQREITLSATSPRITAATSIASGVSEGIDVDLLVAAAEAELTAAAEARAAAEAAAEAEFRFSNPGNNVAETAALLGEGRGSSSSGTCGRSDPAAAHTAASPFAQLALQKTVAKTLWSVANPQQQQQQSPFSRAFTKATTLPASLASIRTRAASQSIAASHSAAAAAGNRFSNSSGGAPSAFSAPAVALLSSCGSLTPPSSIKNGRHSEVFSMLDPETASAGSEHRILKKYTSNSSKGSSSGKLQHLRMSFRSLGNTPPRTPTAAAAASSSGPGSSGIDYKRVWRRSDEHKPLHSSLKAPGSQSTATRRTHSVHVSILTPEQQQQQQQERPLSDSGLPPPYPAAAAGSMSTAASSSKVGSSSSTRPSTTVSCITSLASQGIHQASNCGMSSCCSSSGQSSQQSLAHPMPLGGRCYVPVRRAAGSSGGSSSSSRSLIGIAVTRMHRAQSSQQQASSSSGSSASKPAPAVASSEQVARTFAESFLDALAAGNTKWASNAAVADTVHTAVKMVGMDKQLYSGKTAVIRRLNTGMEQLVKMASAYVQPSSSSSSSSTPAAAADDDQADQNHADQPDQIAAAADLQDNPEDQSDQNPGQTQIMSDLADRMPKPRLEVFLPDPAAKPSSVVATYTFKWGSGKFTLRDEFIVKHGQILRLRRGRS